MRNKLLIHNVIAKTSERGRNTFARIGGERWNFDYNGRHWNFSSLEYAL